MTWRTQFVPLCVNSREPLPELMLTHFCSWGAIAVSGQDKSTFLQGQITCDINELSDDSFLLGGQCDPKGKLWSIFRLFSYKDDYLLFQPLSSLNEQWRELKKYSVFSKVTIEPSEAIIFGIMGEKAGDYAHHLSQCDWFNQPNSPIKLIKIAAQGYIVITDEATAQALCDDFVKQEMFSGIFCKDDIWQLFEIKAGIVPINEQTTNEHIPQALNLDALNGISFKKGCYTGQEVVARAKYRGTNKRRTYLVTGDRTPSASEVEQEKDASSKDPIKIERKVNGQYRRPEALLCHYCFSDNKAIGLIQLPTDIDTDNIDDTLKLSGSDDIFWQFIELPYHID